MDKSELARLDYESGMKYREIAEKHGVSLNTVKSWKKRHAWSRDKKGCTQNKEKGAHKKRGGQPGNKNATGPPRNKNAQKHGLFARYLPDEVNDIMQEIEHKPPIDILWENITLTYANLLHAQRILFVTNEKDHNTFQVGYSLEGESFEVHTAWDKQSKAFQAVARVQAELRQMIKTYDELSRSDLVTEEQRARIDVLKAKINPLYAKKLESDVRIAEAEAKILENKADKLTANSQAFDLLASLSDVMNGGDGNADI